MKALKKPLRKLLQDQGNLHDRVSKLRLELDEVQKALDQNPDDVSLRDEEDVYVQAFSDAKLDKERFLKQKAKVEWLAAGDANSAYFHKTIKSKNHRSHIVNILDANGVEVTSHCVLDVFVTHYEQFLGSSMPCVDLDVADLFSHQVSNASNCQMVRDISNEEIKAAMFDISDDRAPGPDGYTSILKEINHTFIALIPKVSTPLKVNDYRPISCCNVLYKCISKILTNRIIDWIKEVVSENQSAFVPGRRISDNILITQELMHNYHQDRGPPRCAFKVNIQKAYDTVDWRFLKYILGSFGFHPTMTKWIMAYVTSTSFSLSINGDVHGFFKGKRGLRQGDPLYLYLFTLVMEVLTLILQRRVRISDSFSYHKHCEDLKIINVCFADDLFLFAQGDVESAQVIMDSLEEFKRVSGLVPSIPKSTVSNKVSLWVRWIHAYKLNGRTIWDVPEKADMSWGCFLTVRDITREGFHVNSLVADMVANGAWMWPHAWLLKSPILGTLPVPNLDNNSIDIVKWRDLSGNMKDFSIKRAWEIIRPRGMLVFWHQVVWFEHNIPRHAFHLWLLMRRSLKTQDRMKQWDVGVDVDLNMIWCPICELQKDSHEHLFFECLFSAQVWSSARQLAGMDLIQPVLTDIMLFLQPMANCRTTISIIGRLILAASSYFIWLERNNRIFKKVKKHPEEIINIIMVTVRLKLLTFKFKNTAKGNQLLSRWKMPTSFRLYGN
ncbi:protein LAZ1 [Tanacetum coccineum]